MGKKGVFSAPRSVARVLTRGVTDAANIAGKGLNMVGMNIAGDTLEDLGTMGESGRKKRAEAQRMDEKLASLTPGKVPDIKEIKRTQAKSAAASRLRTEAKTGRQDTILTSPLGLVGQPLLKKKTLLGQ